MSWLITTQNIRYYEWERCSLSLFPFPQNDSSEEKVPFFVLLYDFMKNYSLFCCFYEGGLWVNAYNIGLITTTLLLLLRLLLSLFWLANSAVCVLLVLF